MTATNVTVVIPTTGDTPALRRTVQGILRTMVHVGPESELLVVVNGRHSVPALANVGSPQLRVVHLPDRNVARARNVGIAQARHDTVLFGDDDGLFENNWCAAFAASLDDPAYPAVTAPVRVPVIGPVTAYLNYQRSFDAPPLDGTEARTVTGHCGLRRDRVPEHVRYDEQNMPYVGEDVAFGYALRAAGVRVRWAAEVPAGLHVLPDRVEEITERSYRYGRGAALVWCHQRGSVASPVEMLALYGFFSARGEQRYRRFPEVLAPVARQAFTVYDYLYNVAHVLGYLVELGNALEHPFLELDLDGLRLAWEDIAERAATDTGAEATRWAGLPVDYARLDSGRTQHEPLIAELWRALSWHAPLLRDTAPANPIARVGGPTVDGVGVPASAPDLPRLHGTWWHLRETGTPITTALLDQSVRAAGFGFREGCATIELAAQRRVARAAAHDTAKEYAR